MPSQRPTPLHIYRPAHGTIAVYFEPSERRRGKQVSMRIKKPRPIIISSLLMIPMSSWRIYGGHWILMRTRCGHLGMVYTIIDNDGLQEGNQNQRHNHPISFLPSSRHPQVPNPKSPIYYLIYFYVHSLKGIGLWWIGYGKRVFAFPPLISHWMNSVIVGIWVRIHSAIVLIHWHWVGFACRLHPVDRYLYRLDYREQNIPGYLAVFEKHPLFAKRGTFSIPLQTLFYFLPAAGEKKRHFFL